nr:MAG TPA: hypothetical protein [Caudoviricetes sp.]
MNIGAALTTIRQNIPDIPKNNMQKELWSWFKVQRTARIYLGINSKMELLHVTM